MNDPRSFLTSLLEKRMKWVEANRENNFEQGIKNLLTDLYPDKAHFIFELLQNAEDAGASRVHFDLSLKKLVMTHNGGRRFIERDVNSITSIGDSTKREDINQIGKFGIGFKAVFSYTASPRIYDGKFSFEIKDLVCPYQIAPLSIKPDETRFEFPFDHPEKSAERCHQEVADWLLGMSDNALLFLNNIREITCRAASNGKLRISQSELPEGIIEIRREESALSEPSFSYWLRFQRQYKKDSKLYVGIAYALAFDDEKQKEIDPKRPVADQLSPEPVDGRLHILFPAEKEPTNLKFHIQGPYASTVARDSIPHEHEDNTYLLERTVKLFSDTLSEIRDRGLLKTTFLSVLPNPDDEISEFYKPFLDAALRMLKSNDLVPAHAGGHAPARLLAHGLVTIKETISDSDLQFLVGRKSVRWAATVRPTTREERLFKALDVKSWDWESLVDAVRSQFDRSSLPAPHSANNKMWLAKKSDDWMQALYVLLDEAIQRLGYKYGYKHDLSESEIVRLESGEHVLGKGAYFPGQRSGYGELPIVRHRLFLSKNKTRIERISNFLTKIGVTQFSDREEVKMLLNAYYADKTDNPTNKEHLRHLELFIDWWSEKKDPSLFAGYYLLLDRSGKTLFKPSAFYLDSPYVETGLSWLFESEGSQRGKQRLWDGYRVLKNKEFIRFIVALGVIDRLSPRKTAIPYSHPNWNQLKAVGGRRTDYERDEDWTIDGIGDWLKTPTHKTSLVIWRTLSTVAPECLKAIYRPNREYTTNTSPSSLVYQLKDNNWIPDRSGKFHRPGQMNREQLREDFVYDDRNGWLTAVAFGETEKKQTEKYKNLKEVAKVIGLSSEMVDELYNLPEGHRREAERRMYHELKRFKQELTQRAHAQSGRSASADVDYGNALKQTFSRQGGNTKQTTLENPGPVADPDRRRSKIAEEIKVSIENEPAHEERFRRVSRKVWEARNSEARVFLQNQYHGRCQICSDSFVMRNGEPYFEGVYLVSFTGARWIDRPGNVMCLCATCSAKFRHGSVNVDEDIDKQILSFRPVAEHGGAEPTLSVRLCGEEARIKFTEQHILELQALLQASSGQGG